METSARSLIKKASLNSTLTKSIEQMVEEYRHLFFFKFECEGSGRISELGRIEKQKDCLLKELESNGYNVSDLIESLKLERLFKESYDIVAAFTDGGVRNNHDVNETSIAASAFAIYADKKLLRHGGQFIGDKIVLPNGQETDVNSTLAEYHGLLQALEYIEKHNVKAKKYIFVTDCASMVQHVTGKLPQHELFRGYASLLKEKLESLPNVELKHVPREHNKFADKLVNQLLDVHERSAALCI